MYVSRDLHSGPKVAWRPGRSDYDGTNEALLPPDGRCSYRPTLVMFGGPELHAIHHGVRIRRLPDGARDKKHIRDVFYRMGFNDQEIVALSGMPLPSPSRFGMRSTEAAAAYDATSDYT